MTLNIGSQHAGAIYQSAGDQTIHHGGGTLEIALQDTLRELHAIVDDSPLDEGGRRAAHAALAAAQREASAPAPDRARIAEHVEHAAGLVQRAGAIASAANALKQLGSWLGPAGAGLLALL